VYLFGLVDVNIFVTINFARLEELDLGQKLKRALY